MSGGPEPLEQVERLMRTLLELALAPALVAIATLAARRWGERLGGVVSAFPAVVGPALLVTAQLRGPAFAQRAAAGTLLGVVTLGGFALVYGRVAARSCWPRSLACGWAVALLLGAALAFVNPRGGILAGVVVAAASLAVAHRLLVRVTPGGVDDHPCAGTERPWRSDLMLRVIVTAALVVTVTVVAILAGPLIGGMLAGLPVLASVLAAFTHRDRGAAAVVALLRGMLVGMIGFVSFCAVAGALVVPAGIAVAFAVALLVAIAAHAVVARGLRGRDVPFVRVPRLGRRWSATSSR